MDKTSSFIAKVIILAAFTLIATVHAEEITSNTSPSEKNGQTAQDIVLGSAGTVSPISKEKRSVLTCAEIIHSPTLSAELRKQLSVLGYNTTENRGECKLFIGIIGDVYIKGTGLAKLGKYMENKETVEFDRNAAFNHAEKFDAGVIHQAAKLTGSTTKGILIGVFSAFIGEWTGLAGAINRPFAEGQMPEKQVVLLMTIWDKEARKAEQIKFSAKTANPEIETDKLVGAVLMPMVNALR